MANDKLWYSWLSHSFECPFNALTYKLQYNLYMEIGDVTTNLEYICNLQFVCLFFSLFRRFTKVDCMFPLMLLFYWIVSSLAICVICPSEAINLRFTSVSWFFFSLCFEVVFFLYRQILILKVIQDHCVQFLNRTQYRKLRTHKNLYCLRLSARRIRTILCEITHTHTSKHVHIHIQSFGMEWNESEKKQANDCF